MLYPPDFGYVLGDSAISKVHADASGEKEAGAAAIDRSRGGLITKSHAAVDAIGLPIGVHPTPGHRGDIPQVRHLLTGLRGIGHVIADATCDVDLLRSFIADDLGATAQIKANPSRTKNRQSTGASTRSATKSSCSSTSSNASAGSPCAARRRSPPSWASSISHAP